MPRKKKPFISREEGLKFAVVHRSQRDPAIANPDATAHVLVPAGTAAGGTGAYSDEPGSSMRPKVKVNKDKDGDGDGDKSKGTGVRLSDYEYGDLGLPDDGYDYTQHLRPMGKDRTAVFIAMPEEKDQGKGMPGSGARPHPRGRVSLPSGALPSGEESEVGMLNLAAPRGLDLSLDPEMVATLDDDNLDDALFGSDAEVIEETVVLDGDHEVMVKGDLADDFIAMANREPGPGEDEDKDEDKDEDEGSDVGSDVGSYSSGSSNAAAQGQAQRKHVAFEGLGVTGFDGVRKTGAGTMKERLARNAGPMSVASSLISRGGVPTIVEDHFDVMVDTYDDDQIGGLSDEDDEDEESGGGGASTGMLPISAIEGILDEHISGQREAVEHGYAPPPREHRPVVREDEEVIDETVEAAQREPVIVLNDLARDGRSERWDVETVLSTLTNTDNIPGVIGQRRERRIRISRRTGLPQTQVVAEAHDIEDESDDDGDDDDASGSASTAAGRPKGETAEERRERKKAVKAERRAKRAQKKAVKTTFSTEKQKQKAVEQATSGVGASMVKF